MMVFGFSWLWIPVGLASLAFLVQCYHLFFRFSRLAFHKVKNSPSSREPVSVVICARNELKNLQAHLESFLSQDYPEFQVVVVNDCSWDESQSYLDDMVLKHKNLKVVVIKEQEKYQHGKKFALSLGIKAASYDLLLLSDADCLPASSDWIGRMSSSYTNGVEIVIGYGGYCKSPGVLNRIIRFDTFFNGMQYLSAALAGSAYMGVGRNLSYRKTLFFKNKGFANHNHLLSGDDDLFINETARAGNTAVQLHPDSFTLSVAKSSFGAWFRQKRRHQTTSEFYKSSHKLLIGSLFFSHFLFLAATVLLLVLGFHQVWVGSALALWYLIRFIIFGMSMRRLGELDNLWMLPFYDILILIVYPAIAVANMISKPKNWR
ncbi:MAG: hypothetical protein RL090_1420 [Bacteroidota bacterium]|jgi:glycosyltransferase involved in cell wall biosynthesis